MFTFDGPNKIISVDLGVTYFSGAQIYSRWKEWVLLTDNAKFLEAFRAEGRSPTGPSTFSTPYFFVTNGWKIRPQEADHTLTVDGNVLVDGGVGSPFVATIGNFNVLIDPINRSDLPIVETTGNVTGQAIRDAMTLDPSPTATPTDESIDRKLDTTIGLSA